MNEKIRNLLEQIKTLEQELRSALMEQESRALYRVQGARVEFEKAVKEAHAKLRVGLWQWLRNSSPRNIISLPFIYSMLIPLVLLDITVSVYQWVCFRLYNIPRVRRAAFVVIDRQHLAYLNIFEKINCVYCGYGNGVIAYAGEIAARTEQYWCPIKHAQKMAQTHSHYGNFLEYGDAEEYHQKTDELRQKLSNEGAQKE